MRRLAAMLVCGACAALCSRTASAQPLNGPNPSFQLGAGIGAPIGLAFAHLPVPLSTQSPTYLLYGRIGAPLLSGLRIEISGVLPCGFGTNAVIDVIRAPGFRLHLLDPGVFWDAINPVSVQRINRQVDLTAGLGADYAVGNHFVLGLDGRGFFPNPYVILPQFGTFARPIYEEAWKGAQVWFSLSYVWP